MSRLSVCLVLVCFLLMAVGFAIPKPEDHKTRVLDKTLSDHEHFAGDEHNLDYDHEAFLGEEQARAFDELTPEESKLRLGKIVDKMDADRDGQVTQQELKSWIQHTQNKYIADDVDRQWDAHNPHKKEKISWAEYKQLTYGFLDESNQHVTEDGSSYVEMMNRDERRFQQADQDHDGQLTKTEYRDFLHPEDVEHMRDIVVLETLESIDKDKDGKLSEEEYIGDMYTGNLGDEEPDWIQNERDQFSQYRDKDGDGYLDKEEVRQWIIPPHYDHADAEAKHLIYESDSDGDKQLTKDEILSKYDLFVGSQATDFGEILNRHEEF